MSTQQPGAPSTRSPKFNPTNLPEIGAPSVYIDPETGCTPAEMQQDAVCPKGKVA
jgi:hypothetical protein